MHDLRQVLSDLVLQRSQYPRFEGILPRIDRAGCAMNPYCGDAVSVAVGLDVAGDRLTALRCCVEGCAVCKASADLMAECLQGRTREETFAIDRAFEQLLQTGEGPWSADYPLMPFAALHRVPARAACAALPWRALRQALSEGVAPPLEPQR